MRSNGRASKLRKGCEATAGQANLKGKTKSEPSRWEAARQTESAANCSERAPRHPGGSGVKPEGGAPQRGGRWEPSRRRPFPPIFNILSRSPVAQSVRLLGSESPSSSLFPEFLSSRLSPASRPYVHTHSKQSGAIFSVSQLHPLDTARSLSCEGRDDPITDFSSLKSRMPFFLSFPSFAER